jgi:hypothetical protein
MTIGMADYRHRWPSARMTIFTDDYLHGELSAWILLYIVIFLQDTSMDGYLQDIDRSIDTSC